MLPRQRVGPAVNAQAEKWSSKGESFGKAMKRHMAVNCSHKTVTVTDKSRGEANLELACVGAYYMLITRTPSHVFQPSGCFLGELTLIELTR